MGKPTANPTTDDLDLLSAVLRDLARRRVRHEEAEDFVQFAQLKLLERGYEVFRKFAGRSSLRTYLTVVAARLLLDWRNHTFGKWRPSRAAQSLGVQATALDRLIHRDGYTQSEAIEILRMSDPAADEAALRALVEELPRRQRPKFVPQEVAQALPSQTAIDPLESAHAEIETQRRLRALSGAVNQLAAEDRRLLRLRYAEGRSVKAIARCSGLDQKRLYRRFDALVATLRSDVNQRIRPR